MGKHRIDRIEVYRLSVSLDEPWETSLGSEDVVETIYLKLCAGDSFGWGESCPMKYPRFGPEWAGGAFRLISDVLAPAVLSKHAGSGAEIQKAMEPVKGNPFAKAAIDNAWWDMQARLEGKPLWRVIGGVQKPIRAGATFGRADDIDDLLGRVGRAVDAGANRIKLKFRDASDLPGLKAVRRAFPRIDTHVDCNRGLDSAQHGIFQELDSLDLKMIEEPVKARDLEANAAFRERCTTPVCLDESVGSTDDARRALDIGACDWINLKPGRVGGVTAALEIYRMCVESGTGCWIGGMLETPLGVSLLAALASLPEIQYPGDFNIRDRKPPVSELCIPPQEFCAPYILKLSARAGIGMVPENEALAAHTIERAVIE